MLSVADALNLILPQVQESTSESIPLQQGLSRILSEHLLVPNDSPPFDKALMDGFAVVVDQTALQSQSTESACVTFEVCETITAGQSPSLALRPGLATRIMTGAVLPEGCTCVVPIEQTQFAESRPETVTISASMLFPEANLMRRGTAAKAGSVLLSAGTRLQPQQIAALAEFGYSQLDVRRRSRVAVLATGDELISVDQPLTAGKIRNSNEPMLLSQIEASGAVPISLGIARDTESALRAGIEEGLQYDFLLLTGGVSAGLLDLVPQQLTAAGVKAVFHGVHMKPGKPLWFGLRDRGDSRCLVFGLPGNPVSSLTCYELFVRPAVRKQCGARLPAMQPSAILTDQISIRGNRPVYQPVFVSLDSGRLIAQPVPWSGSSDLRATVDANGMALLSPEVKEYRAGDCVDVWLWGDQRLV
jgi:molybdopterin molybdotransferase